MAFCVGVRYLPILKGVFDIYEFIISSKISSNADRFLTNSLLKTAPQHTSEFGPDPGACSSYFG